MNKIISIAIIVVLTLIMLVLGVILLMPKNSNQKDVFSQLPEGWTYQNSAMCKIDFSVPGRQAPYISEQGEYWRFLENKSPSFFQNTAIAIFQNPSAGGSGYVAGAVIVSCKPNVGNESLDVLAEKYGQYFALQNQNAPAEAKITLKPVRKTKIWDKEVLVVSFEGGMYNPSDEFYLVSTPATQYIVSKPQHSGDAFVKQTTEQIFLNLKFR